MEGVNGRVLIGSRWGCFSGDFLACRAGAGALRLRSAAARMEGSPEVEEMGWRGNLDTKTKKEGAALRWREEL